MLDGAARPRRAVRRRRFACLVLGSPTTATCTARLCSTRSAAFQGVKPIIGTEAYMAYDSRRERLPAGEGRRFGGDTEGGKMPYYHLTLLAENDQGYRNSSSSQPVPMEGYYYKPRIDWSCSRSGTTTASSPPPAASAVTCCRAS
ncbi:MAG: PHP domain-containing protein [Ilumatobacteraceae bacterium]